MNREPTAMQCPRNHSRIRSAELDITGGCPHRTARTARLRRRDSHRRLIGFVPWLHFLASWLTAEPPTG
jgi:hypothetical protein